MEAIKMSKIEDIEKQLSELLDSVETAHGRGKIPVENTKYYQTLMRAIENQDKGVIVVSKYLRENLRVKGIDIYRMKNVLQYIKENTPENMRIEIQKKGTVYIMAWAKGKKNELNTIINELIESIEITHGREKIPIEDTKYYLTLVRAIEDHKKGAVVVSKYLREKLHVKGIDTYRMKEAIQFIKSNPPHDTHVKIAQKGKTYIMAWVKE